MFIVNSARYTKNARSLSPHIIEGNTKLWVYPGTLFNKLDNAIRNMNEQVENAVAWAKAHNEFVAVHDFNADGRLKVLQCTNYILIYRVTDDTPQD
jgi:hypothetical protein